MKTMLAAYLPGNSTVDLREVAVPTPGINQVLIKMKSSGICGSDVHYIYHQHRATAAAMAAASLRQQGFTGELHL
ncbi:alcohol dehydrogenase catalytic domain-containing protein, partial [Pseudomonas sp. MOB-449]|nr:alcohol dehydrogenase catalytic domain-containing protein [Pseudomonas sp. MOB-449]